MKVSASDTNMFNSSHMDTYLSVEEERCISQILVLYHKESNAPFVKFPVFVAM